MFNAVMPALYLYFQMLDLHSIIAFQVPCFFFVLIHAFHVLLGDSNSLCLTLTCEFLFFLDFVLLNLQLFSSVNSLFILHKNVIGGLFYLI